MKELYDLNVQDLKYFEKQCLHELGNIDLEKTYLEKIETRMEKLILLYTKISKFLTILFGRNLRIISETIPWKWKTEFTY